MADRIIFPPSLPPSPSPPSAVGDENGVVSEDEEVGEVATVLLTADPSLFLADDVDGLSDLEDDDDEDYDDDDDDDDDDD